MGKTVPTTNCPYEQAIQLVGNSWSLRIIKELHLRKRPLRFNEFMRALKPISSKTLFCKTERINNLWCHKQRSHRRNARPNKIFVNTERTRINSNPRRHGPMDHKMAQQQTEKRFTQEFTGGAAHSHTRNRLCKNYF